jgi:hypothetical protein
MWRRYPVRPTVAPSSARRLPLSRIQGSKLGVIRLHRA